jgi:Nucleotidyltransferase domain
MILPHHQRVIDRLIDLFQNDPRFPAMIVGGSVAKGRARPDSDVDVMLIATDDEYARRVPTHDFWYVTLPCRSSGGASRTRPISRRSEPQPVPACPADYASPRMGNDTSLALAAHALAPRYSTGRAGWLPLRRRDGP